METATFGAGCFWGVEEAFRKIPGVIETIVGYSGGWVLNPSYEDVCSGRTGHAEVVQVDFDPERVSYEALLETFWNAHDPTLAEDHFGQYRSVIFFHNQRQKSAALAFKDRLEKSGRFRAPILTEVLSALPFYRAEECHQRYLEKQRRAG